MTHDIYHKKYYDNISDYKGIIISLAEYPLNFIIGKVIEGLGSGCVVFLEESRLYENELNLEKWVHYVPIYKTRQDKLILENHSYMYLINSDSGKEIAMRGYNHIKQFFNSTTCAKKIIDIIDVY